MSKDFQTVPKHLSDDEKIKFALEQVKLGNTNPFNLTDLQHAFCNHFMHSGDYTISALRAGYSQSSASSMRVEVRNNPTLRLYLRLLHDMYEGDNVADTEEVLMFLTTVMRGEVFEPTKVGVGKGEEAIQYLPPKASERIRAGELLGRRYGAFNENINVSLQAPTFTGSDDIEE